MLAIPEKEEKMITVVSKCKNESSNIREMLASVKNFADEIIIVDDFSTDDTALIAQEFGARVITAVEHSGQIDILDKQGFLQVEDGWILRMDADERLTPALMAELQRLYKLNSFDGIKFARANYLFGKALKHGGWFESNRIGFFRASSWDQNWNPKMHSQVPLHGKIYVVPKNKAFMIHEDYQSIAQFIERTLLRYSAVEALERSFEVKFFHLLLLPARKFFGRYIIRKGFKDGTHGLVAALLLSIYELLILMQIWDGNRRKTI